MMENVGPIRVLVIEDDVGDVDLIREILAHCTLLKVDFEEAHNLKAGIASLQKNSKDLVMLDLNLPDSAGLQTFSKLSHAYPHVPIVILTGLQDEKVALEAIKDGAQDYLLKDWLTPVMLTRSLLCAVERARTQQKLRAVTMELRQANERLGRLSLIDPMTELLNRRGLLTVLTREFHQSRRTSEPLTALLIDLDNFKEVNEKLGYTVGDIVLKEVVHRFTSVFRASDWTARIGGDEFVILLPQTDSTTGKAFAEKARLAIGSSPIGLASGEHLKITASIGLVDVSKEEVSSLEDLLAKCFPALQVSKASGKNQVSEGQDQRRLPRSLDSQMKGVIETLRSCDQFRIVRQPIHSLRDNSVVGFEFLSRTHIKSFENPDDFFKVCLENNMLAMIDRHCFQLCLAMSQELEPPLTCHVNIFPSTLLTIPTEMLLKSLPAGASLDRVCVEISEQQVLGEPSQLLQPLQALRSKGCRVAMDDVGFGRTSLESLIELKPDCIKIDKRIGRGVDQFKDRHAILDSFLRVAKTLGVDVIVEGIETKEELDAMRSMGVPYGQGYYWGHAS